jgi:hypothetical protein
VSASCYASKPDQAGEKIFQEDSRGYSPILEGGVSFNYIFDRLLKGVEAKDGNERELSLLDIYLSPKLLFGKSFSMNTGLEFRPVSKRANGNGGEGFPPRKNYILRGYGLIISELTVEYREEQFLFGFGKFNPTFSNALSPEKYYGVLGNNLVLEYQLVEKLGIYVAMILPMMDLRLNLFKNDSSFLSRSFLNDRGVHSSDDDLGSAKDILDNFSLSANFKVDDSYRVNIGFRRLLSANSKKKPESGYVAGVMYMMEETRDSIGFTPAMEFTLLNNYGGEADRNAIFLLTNFPFFYGGWNFGLSFSGMLDFEVKEEKFKKPGNNVLFQGSIGYKLKNGIAINVSQKYEKSISFKDRTAATLSSWGIGLSYTLKF